SGDAVFAGSSASRDVQVGSGAPALTNSSLVASVPFAHDGETVVFTLTVTSDRRSEERRVGRENGFLRRGCVVGNLDAAGKFGLCVCAGVRACALAICAGVAVFAGCGASRDVLVGAAGTALTNSSLVASVPFAHDGETVVFTLTVTSDR